MMNSSTILFRSSGRMHATALGMKSPVSVSVDLVGGPVGHRLKSRLGRNDILFKALGGPLGLTKVIDATAGFCTDALVLAASGFDVVAVEKNSLVVELVRDGMVRAAQAGIETLAKCLNHLKLVEANSIQFLEALPVHQRPQVIYLDPMFPDPKKPAKSKKQMQVLQENDPVDGESDVLLLERALQVATHRVVVKRPIKAPELKTGYQHQFKGRSIRYDMYLCSGQ
ncbi:MAG: class I SAM-dependent methyltransferase [Pseudobdellovibrionaceae bacterium]|nr:MAG: class I SAM-dependent methyltransferase [Pseudobdellovibrionaceae bacterium]